MTEAKAKTDVKKKRRVPRHLTTSQKAEALALWRSGEVTLDELAKRFKKDRTTFLNLFNREGAQKGETKEKTEKKVQEAVESSIVSDSIILANRIRDTKEEHYKMAYGISRLTWDILSKAKREGIPIGSFAADMKTLQAAANVLKVAREERYAVLGISILDENDDKPLPDLVVQELTSEDIKRLNAEQAVSDEEMGGADIEVLGDEEIVVDENERVETNE